MNTLDQNPENMFTDLTCLLVSSQIVKFEPEQDYAPYNVSEFFRDDVLDKWNKLMPRMSPSHILRSL